MALACGAGSATLRNVKRMPRGRGTISEPMETAVTRAIIPGESGHPAPVARRAWLLAAAAGLLSAERVEAQRREPLVQVWKSATCGCCHVWMDHMKASGFRLEAFDIGNESIRARLGIGARLGSCHTALVGGYAVEGHVPAREVWRLLRERPEAIGVAVPGMPIGSPGMDTGGYEGRKEPYDVLLIARDGSVSVYASYR